LWPSVHFINQDAFHDKKIRGIFFSLTRDWTRAMAAQAESPTGRRGGIMDFKFSILDFLLKSWLVRVVLSVSVIAPSLVSGQQPAKIPFPYGPMGLNSMPWIVAKESNLFAKNGVDVDMIFVGVSTVMIQSMLSGAANIAGLGGPAVISNVLKGGDIIQIAATVPYFTQSLM